MGRVSRVVFLIVSTSIQTFALALCVFKADNQAVLFLALFCVGMPNGATWCLTPTITSEFFGVRSFGLNWGTMMIGVAVLGTGLQYAFGALYQVHVPPGGGTDCYGQHCFTWSFALAATLSLCSVVCYVALWQRRRQLMRWVELERIYRQQRAPVQDSESEEPGQM